MGLVSILKSHKVERVEDLLPLFLLCSTCYHLILVIKVDLVLPLKIGYGILKVQFKGGSFRRSFLLYLINCCAHVQ